MLAAKDGCPRTCEGLLDRQASMDLVNSDGDTALHIASQHKQVGVVELLFDRGARLTVVNKVGQTFLGVALKSGALDVAVVAAKHRRLVRVFSKGKKYQVYLFLYSFYILSLHYVD